MSFKSVVRISKLQSKNKMVGKTFNPSGHTLNSLDKRDSDFLKNFNSMSKDGQMNRIKNLKEVVELCKEKGWSFPFEYNLLEAKGRLKKDE